MTSFVPVRKGRMFIIQKDVPGPMPRALSGSFTDEVTAKKAITLFMESTQNKIKKNLPPKQRRRLEQSTNG